MKKIRRKKVLYFIGASLFFFTCGVLLLFKYELIGFAPFNDEIRTLLNKRLVKVDSLPESLYSSALTREKIIYILGGSQDSLREKYLIAAKLYHKGAAKKILTLSRPGITGYSADVDRNLTNDEWSIDELIKHGVQRNDIGFLSIDESFFGTFAEARDVSAVVLRRGIRDLIVVTSPCHTMRAWLCFSKFLQGKDVGLYVAMSRYNASLRSLILEYIKLVAYRTRLHLVGVGVSH